MPRRLPNLNALRAFDAAARTLSFTRAARELHVTQSAVSHRVRALEEELGVVLFERLTRALRLTPAGARAAKAADAAFAALEQGLSRLPRQEQRRLTVSVLPSFAARWLLPRLARFHAAHPQIDLRILATQEVSDLGTSRAAGEADVAIRFGRGRYPGLTSEKLLEEEVFPACTPALAKRLRTPADLRGERLLHDEARGANVGWPEWLKAAGVRGPGTVGAKGPSFSDASLLLQAATAGQGVALARSVLAESELAAGRLVRPFKLAIPSRYHYALVMPPGRARRAEVQALRAFLLEEARR